MRLRRAFGILTTFLVDWPLFSGSLDGNSKNGSDFEEKLKYFPRVVKPISFVSFLIFFGFWEILETVLDALLPSLNNSLRDIETML
mgnify:FL=1